MDASLHGPDLTSEGPPTIGVPVRTVSPAASGGDQSFDLEGRGSSAVLVNSGSAGVTYLFVGHGRRAAEAGTSCSEVKPTPRFRKPDTMAMRSWRERPVRGRVLVAAQVSGRDPDGR
ncbi:hypothetical protein GCM10017557_62480 [Streptomyces aurantiacus]|uniref:Uncharacterized protein n=1 Tax=Streptomyces aurantiacus TaxID=47760 RepID=A0A7G1P7W9_9ACTN|nr:hypothetical protein GCM10017557_62480 [Streptomyces aurantiacus]